MFGVEKGLIQEIRKPHQIASVSPAGPRVGTASSSWPNVSIFLRHCKVSHVERSLLVATIEVIRRATAQYGQSRRYCQFLIGRLGSDIIGE